MNKLFISLDRRLINKGGAKILKFEPRPKVSVEVSTEAPQPKVSDEAPLTPVERDVLTFARAFAALPEDEKRFVYMRGRLAGRSASEAFNRPLMARSAGAAAPNGSASSNDIQAIKDAFEAELRAADIIPPRGGVDADGQLHRCDAKGNGKAKSGKGDAAYVLHIEGKVPAGWYQNFKTGVNRRWRLRGVQFQLTEAELVAHKAAVKAQYAKRKAEEEKRHSEAAARAFELINSNPQAPDDHPYFVSKGIKAPKGVKASADPVPISDYRKSAPNALIVPMQDADGLICSAQIIDPPDRDGKADKDFLFGGRVQGTYFVIGGTDANEAHIDPQGLSLMAEGVATGGSVFEVMNVPTIVAFNGGNLLPVAKAIKDRYRKARLRICRDDDWKTKGNPGRRYAMEAAAAVDATVCFPEWQPGRERDKEWTDFNDLHRSEGHAAVKDCIEKAEFTEEAKARQEKEEQSPLAEKIAKIDARILELAALDDTHFQLIKEKEAKDLDPPKGLKVSWLEKRVNEARKAAKEAEKNDPEKAPKNKPKSISTVEPWPEAVSGVELIGELKATFKRHMVMTAEQALTSGLWVLHTHTIDVAEISPFLLAKSPEPRCGKTTLMKILKYLAAEALLASAVSAASVYRIVDAFHPTLLCDEGDTYLKNDEAIRGIFNSGHDREGAYKLITVEVAKGFEAREFSTWSAKAIGMIGDPPETIEERSIPIKLRRKKRSESITKLRGHVQEIKNLGRKCARWAADNIEALRGRDATVPQAITSDRACDNWRVLLVLADVISPEIGVEARKAAVVIEEAGIQTEPSSKGKRLLADVRTVFKNRGDPDALLIGDLINGILDLEESPWLRYDYGKQISQEQFGKLLHGYDVPGFGPLGSEARREKDGKRSRKWWRERFVPVWEIYLDPLPDEDGNLYGDGQDSHANLYGDEDENDPSDGSH